MASLTELFCVIDSSCLEFEPIFEAKLLANRERKRQNHFKNPISLQPYRASRSALAAQLFASVLAKAPSPFSELIVLRTTQKNGSKAIQIGMPQ